MIDRQRRTPPTRRKWPRKQRRSRALLIPRREARPPGRSTPRHALIPAPQSDPRHLDAPSTSSATSPPQTTITQPLHRPRPRHRHRVLLPPRGKKRRRHLRSRQTIGYQAVGAQMDRATIQSSPFAPCMTHTRRGTDLEGVHLFFFDLTNISLLRFSDRRALGVLDERWFRACRVMNACLRIERRIVHEGCSYCVCSSITGPQHLEIQCLWPGGA